MRFAHFPHNIIIFCAAKPREYPPREGKNPDNQTRSELLLAEETSLGYNDDARIESFVL